MALNAVINLLPSRAFLLPSFRQSYLVTYTGTHGSQVLAPCLRRHQPRLPWSGFVVSASRLDFCPMEIPMSKPSRLLVTVLAATLSSIAQKSSPAPLQSPASFPATTAKSISIVRDVLPTLPFKCGGTVRRFARPAGRKLRGVGISVEAPE